MTVDPWAGMSEADRARCVASDENLAGIIRGRRAAALATLAVDGAPAQAVREAWEPIRQAIHGDTSVAPGLTYPDLNPPPHIVVQEGVDVTAPPDNLTAAHIMSGHRAVVITGVDQVMYADHDTLSDLGKPVWLNLGSAGVGGLVELAWFGTVVESSWSWTLGPVYVGTNGLLTQTPPTTGYQRQIGAAVDTDTLWLDPQPGIALA